MHPFDPEELSRLLLRWYRAAGRDLPWRNTRDPYRIWLSEVMLQQTGVSTVIPYYERFLKRYPSVEDLAAASVEETIALWAGLGYYSRARNLHRAAQVVTQELGGTFPDTVEGLMALPGVGRSTAGAICSIAFNRKAPILDGNVRRVLVRLYALDQDPRSASAQKRLWQWAEALTPEGCPHDYAQAIMDLGATVCVPRDPRCPQCPLEHLCQARLQRRETLLPIKRPKKATPTRRQVALVIRREGQCLLSTRPLEGMLGGLKEFPCGFFESDQSPEAAANRLLEELGFSGTPKFLGQIQHLYSHFKLRVFLYEVLVVRGPRGGVVAAEWVSCEGLPQLPLHGAHQKALKLVSI